MVVIVVVWNIDHSRLRKFSVKLKDRKAYKEKMINKGKIKCEKQKRKVRLKNVDCNVFTLFTVSSLLSSPYS